MKIALRSIWELMREVNDFCTQDGGDNWHANNAETYLMLHIRPDLVVMEKAKDEPNRSENYFFSYTVDKESHCGGVGKPSEGSETQGQFILDSGVKNLAKMPVSALREEAPLNRSTKRLTSLKPIHSARAYSAN